MYYTTRHDKLNENSKIHCACGLMILHRKEGAFFRQLTNFI